MAWGTKKKSKASIAAAKRAREAAKAAEAAATAKRLAEGDELAIYGDPETDRASMYADYWSSSSMSGSSGYAFGHYASLNSPAAAAFVKQATEWADRVDSVGEPVPLRFAQHSFQRELPTFGFAGMSESQLAWYFTWRDGFRRGEFAPVDDAYVVLLVTEIINGIGVLDAGQAFRALRALNASYGQSTGLRTQLADVLEDYALIHGMEADLAVALREHGLREPGPWYSNRAVQARAEGDLTEMPYDMIAELAGIDLDDSNVFQMENDLAFATFVPRGLAAIDEVVRRAGKGGVLERLAPKTPKPVTRVAFEKTHYIGKRVKIDVPRPPYYGSGDRISALMKGVFRHTENRLRSAAKMRGRTSGFVLTDEHKAAIDAVVGAGLPAFAAEFGGTDGAAAFPAPPKVTVDPERVGRLQVESDRVRGMLIEAMGVATVESPPAASPPSMSSGAEGVGLTGSQQAAVAALLDGGDVESEIRRIAGVMGLLPEVMLDGINEAAIDRFGEAVIDVAGTMPTIHEEYREDLVAWIGQ